MHTTEHLCLPSIQRETKFQYAAGMPLEDSIILALTVNVPKNYEKKKS